MSLNIDRKHELQVMHNFIFRNCNKSRLSGKVSVELLHKKALSLSLKQLRQIITSISKQDNLRCLVESRRR